MTALWDGPEHTRRAIGGHESAQTGTDCWLTPPALITALGPFDLDPCAAPEPRPWPTAARHITLPDDGLTAAWDGRVFLNPPYSAIDRWLGRLAAHGHGTALIFARTETARFTRYVWREATALLFLSGRLTFHRPNGKPGPGDAGAPSVLAAYGQQDAGRLYASGLPGAFVPAWAMQPPAPDQDPLW